MLATEYKAESMIDDQILNGKQEVFYFSISLDMSISLLTRMYTYIKYSIISLWEYMQKQKQLQCYLGFGG